MAPGAPSLLPAPTVGVVGLGRIGTVFVEAIRRFAPEAPVMVAGRDQARTREAAARWPGVAVAHLRGVAEAADMALLCVPPEAYGDAVAAMAPAMRPEAILVSVTNAVSLDDLGRWTRQPIVKIIPSPAHAAGRGACLVTPGPRAQAHHVERVTALLERFSRPILTDPADSRIASNLAGCAPAILAALCGSFLEANAARAQVFSPAELRALITESVAALAALLDQGLTFEDVVARTATPGGTTEAAIRAFMSQGPALCERMVDATFHREAQLLGIPPPRPDPAAPRAAARG